jgi:hypothetical protein
MRRTLSSGNSEDFRINSGFKPLFRPPEGVLNLRSAKYLG